MYKVGDKVVSDSFSGIGTVNCVYGKTVSVMTDTGPLLTLLSDLIHSNKEIETASESELDVLEKMIKKRRQPLYKREAPVFNTNTYSSFELAQNLLSIDEQCEIYTDEFDNVWIHISNYAYNKRKRSDMRKLCYTHDTNNMDCGRIKLYRMKQSEE